MRLGHGRGPPRSPLTTTDTIDSEVDPQCDRTSRHERRAPSNQHRDLRLGLRMTKPIVCKEDHAGDVIDANTDGITACKAAIKGLLASGRADATMAQLACANVAGETTPRELDEVKRVAGGIESNALGDEDAATSRTEERPCRIG